ncbi:MAG: hypothetical protein QOH88_2039 [Verrucomicrobiota bacterium]
MDTHSEKTERSFIKLIVGGLVGLVLFIVLIVAGVHFFHRWQERHLVRVSAAYLSGGDVKAAALTARRAYQMNPDNADAARMIAQIADKAGERAAVDWWRKVVDLQPHNSEDALAFIRAALRFNELALADKALASLGEPVRQTAGYHAAAGRIAEVKKNLAEAESHYSKAAELEPGNGAYQFQFAVVRLESADTAKREAAREALERLRNDPKQRTAATRALIVDGVSHRADTKHMQMLAGELQNYPEATLNDRLLYLEILRQLHDPEFDATLKKLEQETASNPADLAILLNWMSGNETAAAGVEFSQTLPPETLGKWPVPRGLAALYSGLKDWPGLERLTRNTDWQSYDFLRRAYLTRALREQDKKVESEKEWLAVQKEASANPQSVLLLARTAAAWGWESETEDLLWILSKSDETKLEALQTLYQHYSKKGDTSGLYRTLTRLVEAVPNDPPLQNNLAQVSLLLGVDLERSRKVAAELVNQEPTKAPYISTYAFSLYARGDFKGALQAMEKLTPEQLREPSLAVYYGIFLAAAGQKEKALDHLRKASEANLLPEEKALVAKAESALK